MLGFYLHIPFCDKKCTYCDFYSIESKGLVDRFVATLHQEIDITPMDERPLTSIFFGGGTPSLLSPQQIEGILRHLDERYALSTDCEITMEANPGTVSLQTLSGYRAAGITRLSFGVQSFVEEELRFLTRIHSASDADDAMRLARAAGFTNVNLDLMFALPPQTVASLSYSLDRALSLDPDHVSAYSLIFEPGTPLHAQLLKGAVHPQNEELDAEMYATVMDRMLSAGYRQYEVSNYARPGRECRHNQTYWHGEDYLAVGPSAHGLHHRRRYWNHRSLTAWTERIESGTAAYANTETLTTEQRIIEVAFLTLRSEGLPLDQFLREFGVDLRTALQPDLGYWTDDGLVEEREGRLCLTQRGYQMCDPITVRVTELIERHTTSVPTLPASPRE